MITSTTNKRVIELTKLQQKKYRDETGLFIIEGFHLVDEAKKAGILDEVICTEDVRYDFNNVTFATKEVISKIAETVSSQPIIGIARKPKKSNIGNKVVALDNIQDPGNVGTIIRTACAFGFDSIVLSKTCADVYGSKVVRATQGALFNVNVIYDDLETIIKNFDGQVIATMLDDKAMKLDDIKVEDKRMVIFGNEGKGISDTVANLAAIKAYIPIQTAESLNVAVCAGITLYKLQ